MQKKQLKDEDSSLEESTSAALIIKGLSHIKPLSLAFDIERANIYVAGVHPPVKRSLHQNVWRDLSDRVRQRGSHFLSGKQWPGSVYLPSWVVQRLIEKNRLNIPDFCKNKSISDAAKIIALIAGWRQDRSVYEFSGFPLEVVRQSEVNICLVERSFSSAPSHVLYIDLESLKIKSKDPLAPDGFLVGIDSLSSRSELVFSSFYGSEVILDSLELDGLNFDEKVYRFHLNERPGRGYRLNLMLSAFLMICLDRSNMIAVKDFAYSQGFSKPWNRWKIEKTSNRDMEKRYQNHQSQNANRDFFLVSHWENIKSSAANVTLQCAIGSDLSLDKIKNKRTLNNKKRTKSSKKEINNESSNKKQTPSKKSSPSKKTIPIKRSAD